MSENTSLSIGTEILPSVLAVRMNCIVRQMKSQELEAVPCSCQAFLAAGAFTATPRRKTLVNFTMPISLQTSTLLTARPSEVSRALIFMAPFSYDVS